jgi:hypothetical protein
VRQTKHNRHRRRCKLNVFDGGFLWTGHPGVNILNFQGRLTHGLLRVGTHTAYVTAVNGSGQSRTLTLRFTVVAR